MRAQFSQSTINMDQWDLTMLVWCSSFLPCAFLYFLHIPAQTLEWLMVILSTSTITALLGWMLMCLYERSGAEIDVDVDGPYYNFQIHDSKHAHCFHVGLQATCHRGFQWEFASWLADYLSMTSRKHIGMLITGFHVPQRNCLKNNFLSWLKKNKTMWEWNRKVLFKE